MKGRLTHEKKILAISISIIILITALVVPVSAADSRQKSADPTESNAFLIVIQDANGDVVYSELATRLTYVNGTQYSIPSGGTLTTYQYQPSQAFSTGYLIPPKTTANCSLTLTIYNSSSIGGTRNYVTSRNINTSTTPADSGPTNDSVSAWVYSISSTYPYYNGEIKNNSSFTATVAVLVTMD